MKQLFIVKPDKSWRPQSLDKTLDSMQVLLADYEGVLYLLTEIGYEQRPDSTALSTRDLIEEMLADILDLVDYEYEGSARYAIKRLLRDGKTSVDTNTEG